MDGQTCSVIGFIRNGWSDLFSYGVYKKWMVRLVQLWGLLEMDGQTCSVIGFI